MNVARSHPEGVELPKATAGGDTEIEPAAAEPVHRGRDRGQLQRVVQRRDQHGHTEPQS